MASWVRLLEVSRLWLSPAMLRLQADQRCCGGTQTSESSGPYQRGMEVPANEARMSAEAGQRARRLLWQLGARGSQHEEQWCRLHRSSGGRRGGRRGKQRRHGLAGSDGVAACAERQRHGLCGSSRRRRELAGAQHDALTPCLCCARRQGRGDGHVLPHRTPAPGISGCGRHCGSRIFYCWGEKMGNFWRWIFFPFS